MMNKLRLLICAVFLISQHAYAQTNNTDKTDNSHTDISESDLPEDEKIEKPVPVEIGAGGELTLQRKASTEKVSAFEWHTRLLLESRYVTEGRDNLSGHSVSSLSSEFIIDDIHFVPWFAYSPGADYSELNLNFVYGTLLAEELLAYLSYNHIRTRDQGEADHDNEIGLDIVYKLIDQVGAFAGTYHSFDTNGSFIKMGMKYFDELNKRLLYSVQASLGANAGYVADGHNGLNHVQLRANTSYLPDKNFELYLYAAYNQSINRDAIRYAGDETLGDFFWGGVGLNYLF